MRKRLSCPWDSKKLIRIRSSFVGNGDRFPAPNQLAAAASEALPSPNSIL
jgi:hypothetical protein